MYPPGTPVTSPSTIAFTPSRTAIWRASAESTFADGGCFMSTSSEVTEAGETSVKADDPASPARTASLTTRPRVESTLVVRKSVSRIGSRALSLPAASQPAISVAPSATRAP